jgi:hypothetical protein
MTACEWCSNQILHRNTKARFCSRKCFYLSRRTSTTKQWTEICNVCKGKCLPGRKLCSSCYEKSLHFRITETALIKDSKTLRRLLLKQRGSRCEECGLSEWRGESLIVEVHHVDGDSSNNEDKNLKLLCPNCHSLTPNFRRKNIQASLSRRKCRRTKEFAKAS